MSAPPIQIPTPDISEKECDQALGFYMRAWNQLEMTQQMLFAKLLDSDVTTSSIVYRAFDQKTLRDVIMQLGKARLHEKRHPALSALLDRCGKAASKRNRIVHGTWVLNLTMGPRPNPKPLVAKSATWIRTYMPTDRDDAEALMRGKSQKLAANYQFSPHQLISISSDVMKLSKDINDFTGELTLMPAKVYHPVDW